MVRFSLGRKEQAPAAFDEVASFSNSKSKRWTPNNAATTAEAASNSPSSVFFEPESSAAASTATDSPPDVAGAMAHLQLQRQQTMTTPTRSTFALLRSATMAVVSSKPTAPAASATANGAAPALSRSTSLKAPGPTAAAAQPAATTTSPAQLQPQPTPPVAAAATPQVPAPPQATAPTAMVAPANAAAPPVAPAAANPQDGQALQPAPAAAAAVSPSTPPEAPAAANPRAGSPAQAEAPAVAGAATAGAAVPEVKKRDLKTSLLPQLGAASQVDAISALGSVLAMHAQKPASTPSQLLQLLLASRGMAECVVRDPELMQAADRTTLTQLVARHVQRQARLLHTLAEDFRRPEPKCQTPVAELAAHVAALGGRYVEVHQALQREARQGRVARLLGQGKAQEQFRIYESALREHGDLVCDAALTVTSTSASASSFASASMAARGASAFAGPTGAPSSSFSGASASAVSAPDLMGYSGGNGGATTTRGGTLHHPMRSISEVAVADMVGARDEDPAAVPSSGLAAGHGGDRMAHAATAPVDLLDLLDDAPPPPNTSAPSYTYSPAGHPGGPYAYDTTASPYPGPAPPVAATATAANSNLAAPSANPFAVPGAAPSANPFAAAMEPPVGLHRWESASATHSHHHHHAQAAAPAAAGGAWMITGTNTGPAAYQQQQQWAGAAAAPQMAAPMQQKQQKLAARDPFADLISF